MYLSQVLEMQCERGICRAHQAGFYTVGMGDAEGKMAALDLVCSGVNPL